MLEYRNIRPVGREGCVSHAQEAERVQQHPDADHDPKAEEAAMEQHQPQERKCQRYLESRREHRDGESHFVLSTVEGDDEETQEAQDQRSNLEQHHSPTNGCRHEYEPCSEQPHVLIAPGRKVSNERAHAEDQRQIHKHEEDCARDRERQKRQRKHRKSRRRRIDHAHDTLADLARRVQLVDVDGLRYAARHRVENGEIYTAIFPVAPGQPEA